MDAETIDITGHSLGGHLGYMAGRLFPELVDTMVTLNAPGFFAEGDTRLTALGFPPADDSKITAVNAQGDGVNRIGTIHPGTAFEIAQESTDGVLSAENKMVYETVDTAIAA